MSRPNSHIFAALEREEEPAAPASTGWHCPVADCAGPKPAGRRAIFCADHHFQLPYGTTNQLFRWQLKCERCENAPQRAAMEEQLRRYVEAAVRDLTSRAVH